MKQAMSLVYSLAYIGWRVWTVGQETSFGEEVFPKLNQDYTVSPQPPFSFCHHKDPFTSKSRAPELLLSLLENVDFLFLPWPNSVGSMAP